MGDLDIVVYDDGHREVYQKGPTTAGGAYACYGVVHKSERNEIVNMEFQYDVIPEVGVVGWTNESVIAVVIDRLQGFQAGGFSCRENAIAITKLQEALMWLEKRTADRRKRGVEGKHEA